MLALSDFTLRVYSLQSQVVPLIRTDGEIREVAITALGLVNPHAFGDLVEELQSHIHDALDQKKGDVSGSLKHFPLIAYS